MSESARTPPQARQGARPKARSNARNARAKPLLPPAPASDLPLFLVVAIIVALACASAIAARSAWSAAGAWTSELDGAMTVHVRPGDTESAQTAAARAADAIAAVEGVTSSTALTDDDIGELLAPWFGGEAAPGDIPLPGMVDVRLDRVAPARAGDILAALDAAGIDGEVDDHERWTRDIRRAARAARTLALMAFVALLAAAAAVTSFATRASLVQRADVVEVLHLVGADDGLIAGEFTRRFMGLGVRAGALGAVLAGVAALVAFALTQGLADDFLPRFRFARLDVIILVLAPLATSAVAALTARETVNAALRRIY